MMLMVRLLAANAAVALPATTRVADAVLAFKLHVISGERGEQRQTHYY